MSPNKINVRCSVCGFAVTTPDEIVVGCFNGAPTERFDILYAPGDDENAFDFVVPDGYLAYCIDDAPCECGYHPDLMSDADAQEAGWCFNPDCAGHDPVRMAHQHGGAA